MISFASFHPIVQLLYFAAVLTVAMFSMNPLLLGISFFGAFLWYLLCFRSGKNRILWVTAVLFLLSALINPLFSHDGVTVLFILNGNPMTWEAVLYGMAAGGMIGSVLLWFSAFSRVMNGERLLYLFGKLSPKGALLFSMALRYVPLFSRQAGQIRDAQRVLGLTHSQGISDRIHGDFRVASVMVTWGLENGIVTANSMEARGYGSGHCSHYSRFRFRRRDGIFLAVILLLIMVTMWAMVKGTLSFSYYPYLHGALPGISGGIAYTGYAILVLLPAILETEERIRWNCLQSNI